jgi:hypothetical protein
MAAWPRNRGHSVNRERVRRPVCTVGLKVTYRSPRTSPPAAAHNIRWPGGFIPCGPHRPPQLTCAFLAPMEQRPVASVSGLWRKRYGKGDRISSTLTGLGSPPVKPSRLYGTLRSQDHGSRRALWRQSVCRAALAASQTMVLEPMA